MNLKIALLASAAALVGVTSAQAADAVVAVPEPDAQVAVCDVFGAGFMALPGTESCLRFGGYVRASAVPDEDLEDVATGVEARLTFDVRSNTEAGQLRTFVALENEPGFDEVEVDEAYAQLGGLLIGHTETLFNRNFLYGDDTFDFELDIENSNQLRYTYDFANGVYVAASVEDGQREGNYSFHDDENRPDFVGRVGVASQPWGSADVSGIYSDLDGYWGVKGTADLTLSDRIDARVTAAYFDEDVRSVSLGAATHLDITKQFGAYLGGVYGFETDDSNGRGFRDGAYGGNLGVEYTPVGNLTLQGEVGYVDDRTDDAWTSLVRVSRGF